MNIFYLHSDPKTCAEYHVDRHAVSQIKEYAQLLSTAHRLIDGKQSVALSKSGRRQQVWTLDDSEMEQIIYKATHVNHPSAKWARQCAMNYTWLMELWLCLMDEYTHRYGKHHACERLIPYLCQLPKKISTAYPFSPPWRAMPDEYKLPKTTENYAVESYRAYYLGAKQHILKWKNRPVPDWVK